MAARIIINVVTSTSTSTSTQRENPNAQVVNVLLVDKQVPKKHEVLLGA